MKNLNASKVKAEENGAADSILMKPDFAPNEAITNSQAAAQSAIKRPHLDSFDSFWSDVEEEKPQAADKMKSNDWCGPIQILKSTLASKLHG